MRQCKQFAGSVILLKIRNVCASRLSGRRATASPEIVFTYEHEELSVPVIMRITRRCSRTDSISSVGAQWRLECHRSTHIPKLIW